MAPHQCSELILVTGTVLSRILAADRPLAWPHIYRKEDTCSVWWPLSRCTVPPSPSVRLRAALALMPMSNITALLLSATFSQSGRHWHCQFALNCSPRQ